MHRTTRHSAGAALDLLAGGVLFVRLSGPLTGAALNHVKAEVLARYGSSQIAAFAVDYRAAAVALSGSELDAVLEGEHYGTIPSLPAAQIVLPVMLPLFTGHCLRMAQFGIVRSAFTDEKAALRWASRHALRAKTRT